MGRFTELFLDMANQFENDGTFVTTEQIAKSVSTTVLYGNEVKDAFNEGRVDDAYLLQASQKN